MVLEPLRNPLGFGVADVVEFGIAICLLLLVVYRSPLQPLVGRFAEHRVWCLLLLAICPIALRLVLLPHRPAPVPDIYDEFGHLLVADTLRHFRFANPAHPLHQFFETFFVLQTPTYSSIYPLGQGLILAIGGAIFRHPWAGVLLASGAFCAGVYWMLRAWTTALWALLGGLLAVAEFGPLSRWTNDYWGGSLAALAGCLVFGSLPRLLVKQRLRDGVCLGLGLALHWLTRPFESLFLFIAVGLFFVLHRRVVKALWACLPIVAAVAGVTLVHNRQVTGSCWTLPYQLSQYQYGVPASLTFQRNPVPHRELTPQQELGYKMQAVAHGPGTDSVEAYLRRLVYRTTLYRFFFMPPLYLGAIFFFTRLHETRFRWVLCTVLVFLLGENVYPYFQPHYVAALTGLFVLISVIGLQALARWSPLISMFVIVLCGAYFVFWYVAQFREDPSNSGPARRIAVYSQLAALAGKKLVFVRYSEHHVFQDEWVYNDADIDAAPIVWARDSGAAENEKLRLYYPDRKVWLLAPDEQPPSLVPYDERPSKPSTVVNEPARPPKPKPSQPTLRFEDVK